MSEAASASNSGKPYSVYPEGKMSILSLKSYWPKTCLCFGVFLRIGGDGEWDFGLSFTATGGNAAGAGGIYGLIFNFLGCFGSSGCCCIFGGTGICEGDV